MVPEDKLLALARALEGAFGASGYEAIEPLAARDGLGSALVYRLTVGAKPYLLRFVKEHFPGVDPVRELAFMARAAEAGIAPRVWYASAEDQVVIMDLVPLRPLPPDAGARLAALLRRLHALEGFPVSTRYQDRLGGMVGRLAQGELYDRPSLDALVRLRDELAEGYPQDTRAWVPCHHDLKPENTLYDGERFWLIDWEAAFLDDPYVDLAVAANFHAPAEAEEAGYLAAYFGRPATDEERARFFLMSQLVGMGYAAVFASVAARGGVTATPAGLPGFEAFNRSIARGEVDLGKPEAQRVYAQLHLDRALARMATPRYAGSLALLRSPSQ